MSIIRWQGNVECFGLNESGFEMEMVENWRVFTFVNRTNDINGRLFSHIVFSGVNCQGCTLS